MARQALSWHPDMQGSKGPFYIALANRLAEDIASGRLSAGTRLPPQRELAWALGVTHGTITRAYARAEKRGLVKAEVGRGTFVQLSDSVTPSPLLPPSGQAPGLDLARNFALPHLDPDLGEAFASLSRQTGINALLSYSPAEGFLRHREAGLPLFAHFDIETALERILVTSGAQHGMQVLLQGLFKDGDALAVDALSYPNLISAAPRLGVKLIPIEQDSEGMSADMLAEVCARRAISGVVILPNVQNPTGRSISPARLDALAEVAARHDLWVIEDDPYAALLEGPKQSLHGLVPERCCSLVTTSKIVGGGLRVGYLSAPPALHPALCRVIGDTSWMASPISAEIARHWIMDHGLEDILTRKRAAIVTRQKLVGAILKGRAELYPDRLSCWLHLPEGSNPAVFELEAARRGVSILGGHHFAVGQSPVPEAVRLSIGSVSSDQQLQEGLERLAGLIAS